MSCATCTVKTISFLGAICPPFFLVFCRESLKCSRWSNRNVAVWVLCVRGLYFWQALQPDHSTFPKQQAQTLVGFPVCQTTGWHPNVCQGCGKQESQQTLRVDMVLEHFLKKRLKVHLNFFCANGSFPQIRKRGFLFPPSVLGKPFLALSIYSTPCSSPAHHYNRVLLPHQSDTVVLHQPQLVVLAWTP